VVSLIIWLFGHRERAVVAAEYDCGPKGWSRCFGAQKIFHPYYDLKPHTLQLVAQLLYRLCHPGSTTVMKRLTFEIQDNLAYLKFINGTNVKSD
jgi:hypothetical protein